jgi:hypothetical protein
MSETRQLDAVLAAGAVDRHARSLVMSFQSTVELLVAEVRERSPGRLARRRLLELLRRYRAGVLELADTLVALRGQLGTDPAALPDARDADVRAEVARLQEAHDRARREADRDGPAWAGGARRRRRSRRAAGKGAS